MSNLSSQELYEKAYSLHYKDKLYEGAYAIYNQILRDYSDSPEASYSKSQIGNILNLYPDIRAVEDSAENVIASSERKRALERQREQIEKRKHEGVAITSGFNFEGFRINKYVNHISFETAVGVGGINALLGNLAGIAGVESEAIREKLSEARKKSIEGIKREATNIGANAIIGLKVDYETFYETLLLVIVSGTGVEISDTSN